MKTGNSKSVRVSLQQQREAREYLSAVAAATQRQSGAPEPFDNLMEHARERARRGGDDCPKCGQFVTCDHKGPCPNCWPNYWEARNVVATADARRYAAADRRRGMCTAKQAFYREVPRLYHGVTFAGFASTTPKRTAVVEYLHHTPLRQIAPAVLLGGPPGRGKTHLAAALARRYATHGHPVCWANDAHTAEAWRQAHASDARLDPSEIIGTMTSASLLVIDDLGKCRPSDKWAAELYHVIDHRLCSGSPMLITTNCTGSAIREHFGPNYGPALESRLFECRVFPIDGDDMRVSRWAA